MDLLFDNGVEHVHHYTPLHYLPFISRSRVLLGKPSLALAGFAPSHFRSKSSPHDIARGFGSYAFLTLDPTPRILGAKLAAGFPHIGIAVPTMTVDHTKFSLCRFNVAMTRKVRRGNRPGHPESATNGRYYDGHEVPAAVSTEDKLALLSAHLNRSMIEVLIHGDLSLPTDTKVITYSDEDAEIANSVLGQLGVSWGVEVLQPPGPYNRRERYVQSVCQFIDKAMADVSWRGDGLEFDAV